MVDNVRDIELGTLTSGGWDTSAAPVASTANVWQSTSDPTVSADISIGVRRGDVWINTATGNEFKCISHAAGAAVWRHRRRILAQSNTAIAALTGTTDETARVTISIAANVIGLNGTVLVERMDTFTNSANNKIMRTRFGASGAGLGGTSMRGSTQTTALGYRDIIPIGVRGAANSQVGHASTGAGGGGGGDKNTAAIDTTAATEIVLSQQLANSGESVVLEWYSATLTRPDIGP